MKQCIWCRQFSPAVSFNSKAHIVPKGLGGTHICESVCDVCNRYFGAKTNKAPAVEETLKETFHITRLRFLYADGRVGKNKPISKPDSLYFKIDLRKPKLSLKNTYKLKPYFHEALCRQLWTPVVCNSKPRSIRAAFWFLTCHENATCQA
jgi:hypothetical protein